MRASAVPVAPPVVTFQSAVARRVTYLEGDAALTLATSSTTVTEASGLGKELSAPIQVWIRDLKADGGLDAKNNTHNGRYSGKTYLK